MYGTRLSYPARYVKWQLSLFPLPIQFGNRWKNIIRRKLRFLRLLRCRFSGQNQRRLHTGIMTAENIRIQAISDDQSLLSGKPVLAKCKFHHCSLRFSDKIGHPLHRMLQHLTDGSAVRHIAEFYRADEVRIGCKIVYLRVHQNPAGIRQLFISQLVIIGNQYTGDSLVLPVRGHADAAALQLPQKRTGSQHIDQFPAVMLFQILNRRIGGSDKVGVVRRNSQLLKGFDIVGNTFRRVVCDKDKLSAAVLQIGQKLPGSADQLFSLADRSVNVQQEQLFVSRHSSRSASPLASRPRSG